MKGVLVILDGAADVKHEKLNGKTPLEAATTPNLDFLAHHGKLGLMHPVKKGFVPESHESILTMFGNELYSASRGELEALGSGLKVEQGDLIFRANFSTIDDLQNGNILDRRAGRTLTTREASNLADALNRQIHLPLPFYFKNTLQHRGILLFKGGLSDIVSGNDSAYDAKNSQTIKNKIFSVHALNEDDSAIYTANLVNDFLEQAFNVLQDHPINQIRKAKGLMPANFLLLRGPGTSLPKLAKYKKWIAPVYMPLEIGFAISSGMRTLPFTYPDMKNIDVYEHLYYGLKKACKHVIKILKKYRTRADFAYVHIKECDVPGHDNKPIEKRTMIEFLDAVLFKFLKNYAVDYNINIVVTADHATPCAMKSHSADAVPVLIYDNLHIKQLSHQRFTENDAIDGELGFFEGRQLLQKTGLGK